jgi:hypothetical protein
MAQLAPKPRVLLVDDHPVVRAATIVGFVVASGTKYYAARRPRVALCDSAIVG